MDQIFRRNFRNEIIWSYTAQGKEALLPHDVILFYTPRTTILTDRARLVTELSKHRQSPGKGLLVYDQGKGDTRKGKSPALTGEMG